MNESDDNRSWVEQQRDKVADMPTCENAAVFCCPHCGAPVGSTDGRQLTVGAIIVKENITLKCVACRQDYEWQPET